MKSLFSHIVLVISFLVFASSCALQESPITGQKRAYAYSWQQEIQIGRDVDREIVAEYGLYDDPAVEEYVYNLSKEILEVSHMRREGAQDMYRNTEFTFRVLDSPVVNAFALPGGYIYVTRGLLAHLNNDAQLAVVQGHEIGHVAARHASQRGLQQTIGQVAVIGGAILGQELLGLPGETILNVSSQAAQFLFLSYSRDNERESDRLGVEYAAMSDYAAEEGAEFFTSLKRMSEKSGQSIPNMLSSHPNPGEREQNIPKMADEWREKGFEQTIRNTESYMQMLNGIVYGDNPRNGFVEDGQYIHPELAFKLPVPERWRSINQPSQLVYVSPEGDAVMILRIDSQSATPRQSVMEFVNQDGFEVLSQNEAQSSNRWEAYEADAIVVDENNRLGINVYAVQYDGRIYRFINYTEESKFESFSSVFSGVTGLFDELTDERLLNINPVRLNVSQVERDTPFSDLIPERLPMNIDAEELAILNQVSMNDIIPAGTYIKIPVQ